MTRRPRIALVTTQSLYGPPSGGRIRLEATRDGLARVGDVTVVELRTGSTEPNVHHDAVVVITNVRRLPSRLRYVVWLLCGRVPPSLLGFKHRPALDSVLGFRPDLVWFRPALAAEAVTVPRDWKRVIDVDDLEGLRDAHARQAHRSGQRSLRRAFDEFAGRKVRAAWKRYYRQQHHQGAALVTCSRVDSLYTGDPRWVPNGVVLSGAPSSDPARRKSPPTFVFVGRLTYRPNQDAVDELLASIWPAIHRAVPDSRLLIVGAGSGRWREAARTDPSVSFLGEVPDVRDVLSLATATIVPIRSGGGTRLKIIEAFAHRVPVVATSVAVEGLDAIDGLHYLRAERAAEFEEAARRLVADAETRTSIAMAAEELARARYDFDTAVAGFADVARSMLSKT